MRAAGLAWVLTAVWACAAGEDPAAVLQGLASKLGVPCAVIRKLEAAPSLEALPELTKWAGPLPFANLNGEGGEAGVKPEGYLACDGERLYAALRCFDEALDAVQAGAVPLDGDVWKSDSVEVFILPGLDPAGSYFQFAVNPAGSLFDAQGTRKEWSSGAAVKVFRDEKAWTAVLAVPYAALGVQSAERDPLWRVNLHRARPKRGGAPALDLAWSPTHSRSNHVPGRFGLALLEGVGKPFDAAAAQAFVEKARQVQVLFKQEFDAHTEGFSLGEAASAEGPVGSERFLRVKNQRQTRLERDIGALAGAWMAFGYRTAPHQHGLVVQGSGSVVRATRPGRVEVLGRGLKAAQNRTPNAVIGAGTGDDGDGSQALASSHGSFRRPARASFSQKLNSSKSSISADCSGGIVTPRSRPVIHTPS